MVPGSVVVSTVTKDTGSIPDRGLGCFYFYFLSNVCRFSPVALASSHNSETSKLISDSKVKYMSVYGCLSLDVIPVMIWR